jgi:hypothetical protein
MAFGGGCFWLSGGLRMLWLMSEANNNKVGGRCWQRRLGMLLEMGELGLKMFRGNY